MALTVEAADKPQLVLDQAADFLASRPIEHNMVHTLLRDAECQNALGRYWIVTSGGRVTGVALQADSNDELRLTPMAPATARALAEHLADQSVTLAGVSGEMATVGSFAGCWTEWRDSSACPIKGQRIYEVDSVVSPTSVEGELRQAERSDRDLVVSWLDGMQADLGEPPRDNAPIVDRRLPAGHFWIWDDGGAASMSALTPPAAGAVRVQAVFTPTERRGRGYASVCVAAVSQIAQTRGHRCLLYTDLGNRTSNVIYRRIGYRAVSELVRYVFDYR